MKLPETLDWIRDRIQVQEQCWIWIGSISKDGYGRVTSVKHTKGKTVKVTRLIFQELNGNLKEGEVVRHTCDIRSCVNPKHLLKGFPRDNVQDMMSRNRGPTGSNNPRTRLTDQDIINIRSDTRPRKEVAKEYGISKPQVSSIKRHDSWGHVGGRREYHGPSSKLTDEQVENLRLDSRTLKEIARDYNISIAQVSRIRNGKRRKKI